MPPVFKDKGKPEKKNPPVSREHTSAADMPDWLKRVPEPESGETDQPASASNQGMPDWLLELRRSSEQATNETGKAPADNAGIPDWLIPSGDQEETEPTEVPSQDAAANAGAFAGETNSNLSDEPPIDTGSPENAQEETQPEAENETIDIPDWIQRMAPPGVGMTESSEPTQAPEGEAGGIPDWIQRMAPPAEPHAEPPPAADISPETGEASEVPDWLQALKPAELEGATEPEAESTDMDWQAALRAENQARMDLARQQNAEFQAEVEATQKAAEAAAMQEAQAEAEAAWGEPQAQAEEQVPDWVRELRPPPGVSVSGPAPLMDDSERQELPDWLREAPPPGAPGHPATGPQAPTPEGEPGQVPAWMAELKPSGEGRPLTVSPLEDMTETSGPLSGVRGVLPVALAVTQPHSPTAAAAMPGSGAQIFKAVLAGAQPVSVPAAVTKKRGLFTSNRLIYLLVLLAALVPLFLSGDNVGLGVIPSFNTAALNPTIDFFEHIKALQPGATVLVAFDYEPGQSLEMDPIARAVVDDLARRNVNVISVSTSLTGARLAQNILNGGASENPNWVSGTNYVNVGFLPGDDKGRRALAAQWLNSSQVDFNGKPISLSPLIRHVTGWQDIALTIDFAATDDALRLWMEQVQPNVKTPFVGAVSAAVETPARNYWNAKQLTGLLHGLAGAAEYELMIGKPQMPAHLADAQSFVELVVLGVIIFANAGALLEFLKKRRAAPAG